MNKKILGIGVLIVVVLVVIIFANNSSKNTNTIKVGASLALTGNLAYIGTSEMKGLILASEEINAKGGINGRKIEIITEDNQGDAKVAVSGVQKLLSVSNVNLMFTAFTHITKAIAPIIKEKQIPMVYAAADGTMATEGSLIFRDYFDIEQSAVALFKKIQSDGRKSVKILAENNDACLLLVNTFKKQIASTDIKVRGEDFFQTSETDLRTHLTKLNLKKDDVIFACANRHSHLLIKNMSDLGLIETPTYQLVAPFLPISNELSYRELFSKNKTISTWYGFAETGNTSKQVEFIKNYKTRFNVEPLADSAYSYDDIYILSSVLGKCFAQGGVDNKCFKAEMGKVDYTGVSGRVNFDKDGRSNRDTILIQAENNQWKTIK